ncbi:MAG TPA: hypothetical protein VJU15_10610 [Gemmatimonadales bacterium]|nr:hypothetical protein [Gemmatimonadales bacterium]
MRGLLLQVTLGVLAVSPALAQQPQQHNAQDLAKQLSNPVSSLVSVPFQLNWDEGVGPGDDSRFTLNFQPVMPFSLNPKTNFIARIILPYLSQPSLGEGLAPTSGFSDILFEGFFSPAQPKGWTCGIARCRWVVGRGTTSKVPTVPRVEDPHRDHPSLPTRVH